MLLDCFVLVAKTQPFGSLHLSSCANAVKKSELRLCKFALVAERVPHQNPPTFSTTPLSAARATVSALHTLPGGFNLGSNFWKVRVVPGFRELNIEPGFHLGSHYVPFNLS